MKTFPKFWFEGNSFFGWIESFDDLKTLFDCYEKSNSIDYVLDKSKNALHAIEYHKYGLRSECNGDKTLREFLIENDLNVPVCENESIKNYILVLKRTNDL